MDPVKRIIEESKGSIPTNCRTAMAIRNHCRAETIAAFAVQDGLQSLAASLFSALEVGEGKAENPLACVRSRLIELQSTLPTNCLTAQLISAGARLEEISEAAEEEGLASIAAMLAEAEQEGEQ
jgi:hypothetical protein